MNRTDEQTAGRCERNMIGSSRQNLRLFRLLASLILLLALVAPLRAFDEVIDSPMYKAPDLPVPRIVMVFPEEAKSLWLRALERPEADLKYKAADAISLAHRRGVKGLETTVAPLLAALDRPDQDPTVRVAVAQALITLEAQEAAPSLFQQAQAGGSGMRNLVEPALARWNYRPMRAVWLERLRDPATAQRSLTLAIEGLGTVREEQAADRLRELALSARAAGPVRLQAARALGRLRTDGLEKDAAGLTTDPSTRGMVARLAAASLLRQHQSESSIKLLQQLAVDNEPAVAAPAISRLIEIDSKLVVPALDHLLASPDAKVRSLAVEVLRQQPTEKHIRLLSDRLDDVHSEVRVQARRALHELAKNLELHSLVISETTRMLASEQWRGLEQATILLTQLDHKPVAGRFVTLLPFDRSEVCITAAWGLRRLAVRETLPGVLSYVEAELRPDPDATRVRKEVPSDMIDHQLSQLNQFMGQQKYGPADAALRKFIPHHGEKEMSGEARAAAIWALGLIHEGKKVKAISTALEERLNDIHSLPPEDGRVRFMCAITLARLRATEALPSLRTYYQDHKPSGNYVNNACGWAIEQLTGEAMPPPLTIQMVQRNWFLTPHE